MFCSACGKTIPDHSRFCLHCGANTSAQPVEWEYDDFFLKWKDGDRPEWTVGIVHTDLSLKLQLWDQYQRLVLEEFQKFRDKGWEPVSEVGPSAIEIVTLKPRLFQSKYERRIQLVEVRISMRRRKRP